MAVRVNMTGIGLDAITYDEVFERVDAWITDKSGRSRHIACINAFNAALSLRDQSLYRIYNSADITGADGMPFVRWIRAVKRLPCDRIAAPDTISKLAEHAKTTGYTFYLYGGAPNVLVRMKDYLERRYPHIRIVGQRSPPFRELTVEEDLEVIAEINRLRPDIVCVGLGTPKQDFWIDQHLESIRGAVLIASGATFDFFGGRVKMAPEFVRQSGFEWLYRLFGTDFKRLWPRYVLTYPAFIWAFFLQITGLKRYEAIRFERSEMQTTASFQIETS